MRLNRHILVLVLLGLSSLSAVAEGVEEGVSDELYAINLASSPRQFTADDLPNPDVLHAHRLYTSPFVKDGQTWNRLRLGFFGSRAEADAALDSLKTHYPDAWIAEVSAAERLDSSSIAPVVNRPPADTETEADMQPQQTSATAERLALAGAEYGGENAYVYAGLLVPFPGSDLGNGFIQRYWVDWLRYEYDVGEQTIKARAPGASVAIGYGRAAEAGAWSIYLGPVWRNTELSPDDRGSDVRGSQWGMNISLQVDRGIDENWRANGIASYTTGADAYWTRGRVTRKLHSGYAAGVELVLHGNDDYSAWQAGAVLLDIRLAPQASLGLKCGARKSTDVDVGAYLGMELARSF